MKGSINRWAGLLRPSIKLMTLPRFNVLNAFRKIKQRKKSQKPIRYVEIDEYQALIEKSGNLWWRTLISIGYGSGLRHNEILNLTWQDIDFESKLVCINAKQSSKLLIEWESKNHENRIVPLTEQTLKLLAEMQISAHPGYPYIFISPERFRLIKSREKAGKWNSRCQVINNVVRDFGVIRRRAGVANCTLHDLRRSAITNWAKNLPIQVTKQLAGHSNITTTMKYYISVRPEDIDSASQVFNKIMADVKCD